MKAIVQSAYGPPAEVLQLREVDPPSPADDEVLVRVRASSVNPADWIFVTGRPRLVRLASGLFRPKHPTPGKDVAGQVEAVGPSVAGFRPGDEVYGELEAGAYAEYVAVPASKLAPKPANLSFEQAAAAPLAGLTALQGLRDTCRVQAGQRILINGASGGVGTFAVQIAKALGAEVTGVCSTRNLDLVRKLGADHVCDYTREDFTRDAGRYDVILDLVGNRPAAECRRALAPTGRYVLSAARIGRLLRVAVASIVRKQYVVMPTMRPTREDLDALRELIEAGKVTPAVDRTFALAETPDALQRQGDGHARGKKVIAIGG